MNLYLSESVNQITACWCTRYWECVSINLVPWAGSYLFLPAWDKVHVRNVLRRVLLYDVLISDGNIVHGTRKGVEEVR
jgi:hypothetical protein